MQQFSQTDDMRALGGSQVCSACVFSQVKQVENAVTRMDLKNRLSM